MGESSTSGPGTPRRRIVVASRGDALTPYLTEALARRYAVEGLLEPELSSWQRYLVAATTFRPSREQWIERFYKSEIGYLLRSRNARGQEIALRASDVAFFQIHGLFGLPGARTTLYIDCTHRQSADQWPAWNPLGRRALARWYGREGSAYHLAAHLFAFSEPTRRSLVDDYGVSPDRVTVVGAGVNFRDLPELAEPTSEPVVLFVGNDFARKGGRVLLEAFDLVRRRVPNARLLLVGATPAVAPQRGVEVLGRVHDRQRIAALYTEARVFCLPALFDPYPLVLLEAMSHGLPVVASTSCGIPEIVADGQTGHLVDSKDPRALAEVLVHLLDDPAAASRLGAAGRARVEQHFLWDDVVSRMAPVLDELTATSASTRD